MTKSTRMSEDLLRTKAFDKALSDTERQMPQIIEVARVSAKMKWAAFNEYKDAGFTEDQALTLCAQPIANWT